MSTKVDVYKALTKVCPQNETHKFCVFSYFLTEDENDRAIIIFLGAFRTKDEAIRYKDHLHETTKHSAFVVSSRGSWFYLSSRKIENETEEAKKFFDSKEKEREERSKEIREENENLKDPMSLDTYTHTIYQHWRATLTEKEAEKNLQEIRESRDGLEKKRIEIESSFPQYREDVKKAFSTKLKNEQGVLNSVLAHFDSLCPNGVCKLDFSLDEEKVESEPAAAVIETTEIEVPQIVPSADLAEILNAEEKKDVVDEPEAQKHEDLDDTNEIDINLLISGSVKEEDAKTVSADHVIVKPGKKHRKRT